MTFLAVAIFASPAALTRGAPRGRPPSRSPGAAARVRAAVRAFGPARLSQPPPTLAALPYPHPTPPRTHRSRHHHMQGVRAPPPRETTST